MSSIQIRKVSKTYGEITLKYPDFHIGQHNILLVGKNGSGKSTLLKAIIGWIHYQGEIEVDGELSIMMEHPTFPRDVTVQTVLDVLCPELDTNMISEFALKDTLPMIVSTLSKGMRAKLNLLQCIGKPSDIYIFDEPLSGLDKASIKAFLTWLQTTTKRWVVTTHQPELFYTLPCEVIMLGS